jgi:hypothetical protein
MIRSSALLLLLVIVSIARTQIPTMHIKKKDGSTVSFPIHEIQKLTFNGVTSAGDQDKIRHAVMTFALFQNYPNPFNPATTIEYRLEKSANVTLSIFNVGGQCLRSFSYGQVREGIHQSTWDGKDEGGQQVASGVYFYMLRADQQVLSNKMILIK